MSFFSKLFGKKTDEHPPAPVAPAKAPGAHSAPDLSKADQLLDCAGVDWNEAEQRRFVSDVLAKRVGDKLAPVLHNEHFHGNEWCSPVDAAVLFAILAEYEPSRIMEVGSGYSTLVIDHARRTLQLPGEVIAVDPDPRIDITEHVDAHLQDRVQDVPVSDFQILVAGELLLLDTTHIYQPGGDSEYLIGTILPALNPGVLVGLHGIRLPRNYSRAELQHGYSEQERLLDYLRTGRSEMLFAGAWFAETDEAALRSALPSSVQYSKPTCLWFRTK